MPIQKKKKGSGSHKLELDVKTETWLCYNLLHCCWIFHYLSHEAWFEIEEQHQILWFILPSFNYERGQKCRRHIKYYNSIGKHLAPNYLFVTTTVVRQPTIGTLRANISGTCAWRLKACFESSLNKQYELWIAVYLFFRLQKSRERLLAPGNVNFEMIGAPLGWPNTNPGHNFVNTISNRLAHISYPTERTVADFAVYIYQFPQLSTLLVFIEHALFFAFFSFLFVSSDAHTCSRINALDSDWWRVGI